VRLIATLRDYQRAVRRGGLFGTLRAKLAVLRHRFWSVVTGADIPLNTWALGEGLELPHPNGVVIHPDTEIGENCRIFQQVTLGTGPIAGVPRVGSHVHIGAGAKIIGGVSIGDGAVIGANSVVVSDVPAGMTAAGIPAELKPDARCLWDQHKRGPSFVG
jgi:serine O-acetyltransferase